MKKIVLICFFLFAAATAYAQNAAAAPKLCDLETDAAGNYLISSKEDWETLAYYVKNGKDYSGSTFNTANKTFLLTKDIEDISVPLGCQTGSNKTTRKRFAGTFEGDGHTITININSGDGSDTWKFNKGYAAPFAYTKNVKVKNLHVKIVSDALDVAVLFGAEQIPGSADLKVAKCDLESRTELGIIAYRGEPLC